MASDRYFSSNKATSATIWPPMAGSMPKAMPQAYDRARALFPADVLAWVQATQPKAWETLTKNHGAQAAETLLDRLRDQLDERGTLDVLRHGIELLGLKQPLKLAQFKPALAMNPDIQARYAANRLRVVRQVRYSLHNENCIDLVLFLNGIPVATVELKTDFTQSIGDAIDQYRFDRNPSPRARQPSRCWTFPRGALVHFAVSNTRSPYGDQAGRAGHRLPALQPGRQRCGRQPGQPARGHRTAYLWEKVWARESWLEIIGRYLIAQRDKKKQIRGSSSPLPPAGRHPQAAGRRAGKARAAST
jgi:type I restriction enzyme R subunit